MGVRYNKLFKLLIDKDLKKTEFAKQVGFSSNTLSKLSRNEIISLDIIVRICTTLGCTIDDILDIVPDNQTMEYPKQKTLNNIQVAESER